MIKWFNEDKRWNDTYRWKSLICLNMWVLYGFWYKDILWHNKKFEHWTLDITKGLLLFFRCGSGTVGCN